MKRIAYLFIVTISLFSLIPAAQAADDFGEYKPAVGDCLFQSLHRGILVNAIEKLTESPYSHCGMVVQKDGQWHVIEGIGPVREIPLKKWIAQGRDGKFDAYRPTDWFTAKLPKVVAESRKFLGLPYDIRYRPDDSAIYCSELIYKAYHRATGVWLGRPFRLGDLDWKPYEPLIISIEGSVPLDRKIIAPVAIARSEHMKLVHRSMPVPAERPAMKKTK